MGKKKTTSSKLDYLSKYVSGKKKIEEEEPPEEDGPVIVDPSEMLGGAAGFNVNQGPTSERRKSRKKDHRRRSESPSARRRRYDSEDEQRSIDEKRSRRYDSDDDEPTVKRHDSDEEEQPVNHRRPRKRYDSEDEEQPRRKRYDSEDDEQQPRRKRYDSEDEELPRRKRSDSEDSSRERMSSGHVAGLQSAGDFSKQEALLQHEKRQRTKEMVEQHGMGDTVYRNGEGQKVKGVVVQENRRQLTEAEATLLKTGRVQRERQEAAQRELESMQHSSLARYADDAALEAQRKAMLRADDPMMRSSQSQRGGARPIYKGPPAKPNRYGIRPGYRWDGVDRGNGWEDRLLAQKYSKQHERERAYRWSTADL